MVPHAQPDPQQPLPNHLMYDILYVHTALLHIRTKRNADAATAPAALRLRDSEEALKEGGFKHDEREPVAHP